MKIRSVGANQTEVMLKGIRVLFSYETPVAACVDGKFVRTTKKWSVTTSRHINRWLRDEYAVPVSQEEIETLVAD